MDTCPRCNSRHGVGLMRVVCSGALFPAVCKACGTGFYPAAWRGAWVSELVFLPFGLAAVAATSGVAVGLIFASGFVVAMLAIRAFVPLVSSSRRTPPK